MVLLAGVGKCRGFLLNLEAKKSPRFVKKLTTGGLCLINDYYPK